MVKNLNTLERSLQVRVGKFQADEQSLNSVVINASETPIVASNAGIYMAPLRQATEAEGLTSNVITYNQTTKEIFDSGLTSHQIQNLANVCEQGATTSTTVSFTNPTTSFVTTTQVGIANVTPANTLDVGTNFSVNDAGSNVLTVRGGAFIDGDLTTTGTVTSVKSVNLEVSDPIIEIGKNNTDANFLFDAGVVMNRPASGNIALVYREDADEFAIGYTANNASERFIEPRGGDGSNLAVHVYGNVEANTFFGSAEFMSGISNIAVLESNVSTLNQNIASNLAIARTDLQSNVVLLRADIDSNLAVARGDLQSNVTILRGDLQSNVALLRADIDSNLATARTDLQSNVTILNQNIASNVDQSNVYARADLQSNVGILQARLNDNSFRITTNATDLAETRGWVASNAVTLNQNIASNLSVARTDLQSNVTLLRADIDSNAVILNQNIASNLNAANTYSRSELQSNVGILNQNIASNLAVARTDLQDNVTALNTTIDALTLQNVTDVANTVSNCVKFTNTSASLVTSGAIGVGVDAPTQALHVEGNVFASQNVTATNVVFASGTVLGNTAAQTDTDIVNKLTGNTTIAGNLHVVGTTTQFEVTNKDLKDPILGLGVGVSGVSDVGFIGEQDGAANSNIACGFESTSKKFIIGYTDEPTSATSFNADSSQEMNVSVVGSLTAATKLVAPHGEFPVNVTTPTIMNPAAITIDAPTTVITGALDIRGATTYVSSTNIVIDDPVVELANNNTVASTDLGHKMIRPGANVLAVYKGTANEFVFAHANGNTLDADATKTMNVHVVGSMFVDSTLNVGSNVLIDEYAGEGNVVSVLGNVRCDYIKGNGSELTGISSTLQQITENGATSDQTITLTHDTTGLDVTSNVIVGGRVTASGSFYGDGSTLTGVATSVQLAALNTEVDSNAVRVGTLETDLAQTILELDSNATRVSTLETDLAQTILELDSNATRIGTLEADTTQIILELDSNATRIGTLETNLTQTIAELDSNATRVGTLETNLTQAITELDSNAARVGTLETNLTQTIAELDSNATRVGTLETDLTQTITELDSNATRVGTLETDLTQTIAELDSNAARVGTLETTYAPLANPTFTSGITVTTTASAAAVTVSDLTPGRVVFVDTGDTLADDADLTWTKSAGGVAPILAVDGDLSCSNLIVSGGRTEVYTVNAIVNDALIELANNNVSDTLDMGIIMTRPTSNVAIGYRGDESEFMIGHTLSDPSSVNLVPDTSRDLHVHAYGKLTVESNLEVGSSANVLIDHTCGDVKMTHTDDGSSAGPVLTLHRVSASASNGDYMGQLKFTGKNDVGATKVYAKMTAKTNDVTDGTEDGLFEFAVHKNGSIDPVGRLTSSALKLINDTGLEVNGTSTFDETATFSGAVTGINVSTGNCLVAGNVTAASFIGDGSSLSGIASDLQDITENGASSDRTVSLTHATTGLSVSSNVSVSEFVFASNVAVDNTNPVYQLSVGPNVFVHDGTVTATAFSGDGSSLTGLATTFQSVSEFGATTDQTISFTNVTTGITVSSNLVASGNVTAQKFIGDGSSLTGLVTDLQSVTNSGASSNQKITLTNATGIQASGNVLCANLTSSNVVYAAEGLVTNTSSVGPTIKRYCYSGSMANSNVAMVFSTHTFYAKITAQLIHDSEDISTFVFEISGGKNASSGTSSKDIALGRVNKFGHANSYPWHDEIDVSPTELVIKPDQAASGGGNYAYDLFIEYMSSHAGGKLVKIMENQVDQHSFAY